MAARWRRRRLSRSRPENGAVAVEFALVVPILMMVFFGMITFGLTYNDNLSISNAAREGARLGAALDYTPGPAAWATSVQTRVAQVYFNDMSSITANQICVDLRDSTGTLVPNAQALGTGCASATPPTLPTGMVSGTCAVRVWIAKPARLSWLLVPDKVFNLKAGAVANYGLKGAAPCSA